MNKNIWGFRKGSKKSYQDSATTKTHELFWQT